MDSGTIIDTSKVIQAIIGVTSIDRGKNAGFVAGSTVCIYSFTGEKTACGRIRKISESNAMIEINNRKAKHIKNGMEAMLTVEE